MIANNLKALHAFLLAHSTLASHALFFGKYK